MNLFDYISFVDNLRCPDEVDVRPFLIMNQKLLSEENRLFNLLERLYSHLFASLNVIGSSQLRVLIRRLIRLTGSQAWWV